MTNHLVKLEAQNTPEAYDKFWQYIGDDRYGRKRAVLYDDALSYLRGIWQGGAVRLVDVGCGPGWFLHYLGAHWEADKVLSGIDWSGEALRLAAENMPHANFYQADLTKPHSFAQVWDVVVCMQTLEHIEAPQSFMMHLMAITQKHLIVTVPNGDRDQYAAHKNFWGLADFRSFCSRFGRVVSCQYIRGQDNILAHIEKVA